MKSKISTFLKITFLLFVLSACTLNPDLNEKQADPTGIIPTITTKGIINPSDPNLDPNWNWTQDKYYTLYYGPNNKAIYNRQLPFFLPGHPLNTHYTQKDMYPEDGWVLAFRDFGTPTRSPELPFFVLYNKYRAILRIMFYNAKEYTYSNFQVKIKWNNTSQTGAYFTMTDKEKTFLNNYDKTKDECFISTVQALNGWGYADFIMAGYDPNANSNAVLNVNITGINIIESSESGKINLKEELKTNAAGGSKPLGKNLMDSLKEGARYYKDINDGKKSLLKEANSNKGKWWANAIINVASSGIASYIPVVGGAIGFITSFIGGKKKATPKEPMVFNGTLELAGTTKEVDHLTNIGLIFSKGPLTTQAYRPVSDIKWGIFNLKTQPVFTVDIKYLESDSNGNGTLTSYGFSTPVQYVLNPDLNIVSVKLAKVYSNKAASTFSTKPSHGIGPHIYYSKIGTVYGTSPDIVSKYAIEITIKNNSPKYFDSEYVLYKVFPIKNVTTYSYEDRDTQAPSTPTGLYANNIGKDRYTLNWSRSSDNVGVKGYRVYLNGSYKGFTSNQYFTITGLSPNTYYRAQVRATDNAGNNSSYSATLGTQTLSNTTGGNLSLRLDIQNRVSALASVSGGTGNYQYTWVIDNKTTVSSNNSMNISYQTYITYSNGGYYTVKVTVKDLTSGKTATASTSVKGGP